MKTVYKLTLCGKTFMSKSYEDLRIKIANDRYLKRYLEVWNITKVKEYFPTTVIKHRFLRKPVKIVVMLEYEIES